MMSWIIGLSFASLLTTGSTIVCHCTDESSSVPCNNKDQTCVLSQGGGKCYFDVTSSGNEKVFGCYENDILTKCVNKGISRQCCDDFDKCNIEFLTPTLSRSIALSTTVPSNISSIDVTSTNDSITSVIIISTPDSAAIVTYASSIPMHTTAPINNSTTVQPECSCADSVPKYGERLSDGGPNLTILLVFYVVSMLAMFLVVVVALVCFFHMYLKFRQLNQHLIDSSEYSNKV